MVGTEGDEVLILLLLETAKQNKRQIALQGPFH